VSAAAAALPRRRRQRALFDDSALRRRPDRASAPLEPDERSDGGRPTLGQKLDRVWEGLTAAGIASCPMCSGEMHRDERLPRGSCSACGTTLS
jgi:hypothetical protein